MCAEHFSEKCEENTRQATGAGCMSNDVANFETKLAKFGGDTDTDALRGSRVLYDLQGPKAVGVIKRRSPSTDSSGVNFGQRFGVPLKDVNCLSWQSGHTISDSFPGERAVTLWRALHVHRTTVTARTTLTKEPHHSRQDSFGSTGKVATM